MAIKSDEIRVRHSVKGRIRFSVGSVRYAYERSARIEKWLSTTNGISGVEVRPWSGSIILFYNHSEISPQKISQLLEEALERSIIGTGARKLSIEEMSARCSMRCDRCEPGRKSGRRGGSSGFIFRSVVEVGALTLFVGYTFLRRVIFKSPVAQGVFSLTSAVSIAASIPLFAHAIEDMRHGGSRTLFPFLAASILLGIALGEALTALEVIWILRVGMLLEEHVAEQSGRAIREILQIAEKDTYIFVNGAEVRIKADEVKPGDTVVVHTGEKIPVDGTVVKGRAVIDESHITGRSEPEVRGKECPVFAGTIVQRGVIYIRAERVGEETYLCRILQLVEDSLENRAPVEQQADILAARLFRTGVIATLGTLLITMSPLRAFTVMLVMACPCATVLSASTAISAAIANAARNHILIKGGLYLEMIGKADGFCFDKTGTLTTDAPQISEIITFIPEESEDDLLRLAALAEVHNEHPLAKAVMREARARSIEVESHVSCEFVLGLGVMAQVNGDTIKVGNGKFMRFMESGAIDTSFFDNEAEKRISSGETLIYVAKNQVLHGVISVRNTLRPSASSVLKYLREDGVSNLHLITGDSEPVAKLLADELGFDAYSAELMPEDKASHLSDLERRGQRVVMVGDGVNDALALSKASVGIAMGAGGADVAIEAADIAQIDSDLKKLITLRKLSRQTLRVIDQNYYLATSTNIFGMVFGAAGILTPLMGGLLHIVHTLGILLNSSRLLEWKPENEKIEKLISD